MRRKILLLIFLATHIAIFNKLFNRFVGAVQLHLYSPAHFSDIKLYKSIYNIIFFPFIVIPQELLLTYDYKLLGKSIIFFIAIFSFIIALSYQQKIKMFLFYFIVSLFYIITILSMSLFMPLPKVYPISDKYIFLDLHSHTYYSHDGIVSPAHSILWHKRNNFLIWAVTEHNNTKGGEVIKSIVQQRNEKMIIYSGEEIRQHNGYFNYLNNKQWTLSVEWWKRKYISLHDTIQLPIDGIEVFSAGFPWIPKKDINTIYKLAIQYKKIPLSNTDWHGWGWNARTWNAMYLPNHKHIPLNKIKHIFVKKIKAKKVRDFVPLILERQRRNWGIFSFLGVLYNVFRSINMIYALSIIAWGLLFIIIKQFLSWRQIIFILNIFIALWTAYLLGHFLYLYSIAPSENKILWQMSKGMIGYCLVALCFVYFTKRKDKKQCI